MTTMTTEDFEKIFAKLADTYPSREIKEGTFQVYYEVLSNLPLETVAAAVIEHIAESTFFPAVSEIYQRAKKLGPNVNPPDVADAWAEVMEQVRHTGSYGTPTWSDPAIAQTVKSIGWREICLSEEPTGVTRAHFMKFYETYRERAAFERNLLPSTRAMLKAQEAKRWDTFMTMASGKNGIN